MLLHGQSSHAGVESGRGPLGEETDRGEDEVPLCPVPRGLLGPGAAAACAQVFGQSVEELR